jgi:plasmid maintenance system antidote protein VapI
MNTVHSQSGVVRDETEFFGVDEDIMTSLTEYGLLIRNTRSDEYEAYYKVAQDRYSWSIIYKSEISDMVNGKSWLNANQIKKLLTSCGQTLESFMELPFEYQISAVRGFLGHTNTFGKTIEVFDLTGKIVYSKKNV